MVLNVLTDSRGRKTTTLLLSNKRGHAEETAVNPETVTFETSVTVKTC